MKYILFLILAFSILSCIKKQQLTLEKETLPNLVVKTQLIRTYDSLYKYYDGKKITRKTFDISISISNKTDSIVKFWMMTCSWDDNIVINNDYIYFTQWPCSANYPRLYRLNPSDSLVYKAAVIKVENTWGHGVKTTKFGLIYIEPMEMRGSDFYELFFDKSKYDKIYWSNPLYLNE